MKRPEPIAQPTAIDQPLQKPMIFVFTESIC
jgi:hypothetical protein